MNKVAGIVLKAGMVFERRWRQDRMGLEVHITPNNLPSFRVPETFAVNSFLVNRFAGLRCKITSLY